MWAMTFRQPRAALFVRGYRPYDPRPYRFTKLIGQRIAIHASNQRLPMAEAEELYPKLVLLLGERWDEKLVYGQIIATAMLEGIHRILASPGSIVRLENGKQFSRGPFGKEYRTGRWCWHYTDIELLAEPVHAYGMRRPWQWNPREVKHFAPSPAPEPPRNG